MNLPDARSLSSEAKQALRERAVHAVEVQGQGVAEAARALGVHRCTVSGWLAAYRRAGQGALAARRLGRPRRPLLDPAQRARLLGALRDHTPDQVGLAEALWTREAVAAWAARELGLVRSRWAWGRWLRAQGFTPQRPCRRAYERDPAAVARWLAEDYPRIAAQAQAEGADVHWLDEAGLRSDHRPGRGYAPRGRPPALPVPGRRFGVSYVATVTNQGVLRFLVYTGKLTQAVLLLFLGRLLEGHQRRLYIILDGHPTHRSRGVRRWVAERQGRLRLVFLPPYSPELNPAEYLNNDVKANAQRTRRPRDQKGLARQVRSYLFATQLRRHTVRAYFRAPPIRYAA